MLPKTRFQKILLLIVLVTAGICTYYINYYETDDIFSTISNFVDRRRAIDAPESKVLTQPQIEDIRQKIYISNSEQKIFNAEQYELITKDTFVLVIQVHLRYEYLSLLIQSLASAQGINDSLIIFSHDVYSPEMNAAIQELDFARIMQIFVPITRQLNPELYPSTVHKVYGANIVSQTLTKQHWWWKANFVFSKIRVLQNFEGVIHFLEEDDYVIPDYIFVMKKLETLITENLCFGCNILLAGQRFYGPGIESSWKDGTTHNMAIVSDYYEHTLNRGLGFNRSLWETIKACERVFCDTYKDINWDYSLMYTSMTCLKKRLTIFAPEAPRLFHIGDCGMHFHAKVCNPIPGIEIIKQYINDFKYSLYPSNITVNTKFIFIKARKQKESGHWSKSDSELCFLLGS